VASQAHAGAASRPCTTSRSRPSPTSWVDHSRWRKLPEPDERGLVQPERGDPSDAVGIVDQRGAVGDHRPAHGMPVTTELACDLGHGAAVTADLLAHPPGGPVGDATVADHDPFIDLGPRPDRAAGVGAAPADLAPHRHDRAAERGQNDQPAAQRLLDPRPRPAARASGRGSVEAMWTCIGTVQPITPKTSMSASPTRARHRNVGSTSTGTPRVGGFRHPHSRGVPVHFPAPSAPAQQLPRPLNFRSARFPGRGDGRGRGR
jgi:hypothetical protein